MYSPGDKFDKSRGKWWWVFPAVVMLVAVVGIYSFAYVVSVTYR